MHKVLLKIKLFSTLFYYIYQLQLFEYQPKKKSTLRKLMKKALKKFPAISKKKK